MVRLIALLPACCFWLAFLVLASIADQGAGATTSKKGMGARIIMIPKSVGSGGPGAVVSDDSRSDVMQFSKHLFMRMVKIHETLPRWGEKNDLSSVRDDLEKMNKAADERRWEDAENAADDIFRTIEIFEGDGR